METAIYRLKGVEHYYGLTKALDIKELVISKGSITGLMGPNGSGKSTLLKLLTFAETPASGTILFKGNREHLFSSGVRSKITLLTQKPYLLKRNVFDNTAYGLRLRRDNHLTKQRVARALERVGLPFKAFAHRKWHELSGGEAQRVALAARLILEPEVLLLDEPTASVDADSAKLIRSASLTARKEWGTTLIIASHDWLWLSETSDHLLHLYKGNLLASGIENVVTGPWLQTKEGLFFKDLGDGQRFFIPAPPLKTSSALIKKDAFDIITPPEPHSRHINRLKAKVTRLRLENRTFDIITDVTIGQLPLTFTLNRGTVSHLGLYPGKSITIRCNFEKVTWL